MSSRTQHHVGWSARWPAAMRRHGSGGNRAAAFRSRRGCLASIVLVSFAVALLLTAAPQRHDDRSFVCPPKGKGRVAAACVTARDRPQTSTDTAAASVMTVESLHETQTAATEIDEPSFWTLVEQKQVAEGIIVSWSGKQLLARLQNGSYVGVKEESDVENLRTRLLEEGVRFSYPSSDMLTEEEALEKAEFSSEAPVAAGFGTALAVGFADIALELGAATGGPAVLTAADLEAQSLFEGESPQSIVAEDIALLEKAVEKVEQVAATEVQEANGFLGKEVAQISQWFQDVAHGLVANHAPGIGGWIEDSYMALLTFVSLFSLYQMAFLKRKANTWSGLFHTATGAMQIGVVVYAIIEERCLRESPGAVWAVATFAIFMVNNLTMWPLLKYFKGPEFQRVLFKLAYSFIISFQGIHAIAWSIAYPWLYWVVMPFWYYSILKLAESSDNIFALLPDGTVPIEGLQEAARRRVKGLKNDTPTQVYSILNFGGAVFDNLYMAVYTWRGPEGFWGYSQDTIPAINDHLRTALVKPAFGSLTISVLVFVGTLVYRKKITQDLAIILNVILASVGPWLILYYHKLIDWEEPWQPEIMGDWGSTPYFYNHWGDLGPLLLSALGMIGIKAFSVAPAVAEATPDGFQEVQSTLQALDAPPIGLPEGLPPASR